MRCLCLRVFIRRLIIIAATGCLTACHKPPPPSEKAIAGTPSISARAPDMPGEPITQGLDKNTLSALLQARLAEDEQRPVAAGKTYLAEARTRSDKQLAALASFDADQAGDALLFNEASTLWQQLFQIAEPITHEALTVDDLHMMRLMSDRALKAQHWTDALSWQLALDRHGHHAAIDNMLEIWMTPERLMPREALRVQVSRYLSEHPSDDITLVNAALLAGQGRDSEALSALNQLLNRTPYSANALFAKAFVEQRLGQRQNALHTVHFALSHSHGYEPRLALLGIDLELNLQQQQQAYRHIKQLLQTLAPSGQSTNELAQFLLDHHHPDTAMRLLLEHPLSEADTHNESVNATRHALLGIAADANNDKRTAYDAYLQVSPASPLFTHATLRLFTIMQEREDLSAAAQLMHAQQQRFPDQRMLLIQLEIAALQQNHQDDNARQRLEESVAAHPEHDGLRYLRAMQRVTQRDTQGALADLALLVHHQPNNPIFLNAYGYALTDLSHRYAEALPLLRRATALAPGRPELEDSLGWTLYQMGEYQEAEQQLGMAYRELPSPEVALHYLSALCASGNITQAKAVLTALLRSPALDDTSRSMLKQRFADLLRS